MKPGSSVASPSSTTSAPEGTGAVVPTDAIFPSTTTTWPGETSLPLFASKRREALRTKALEGRGGSAAEAGSARREASRSTCLMPASLPASRSGLGVSLGPVGDDGFVVHDARVEVVPHVADGDGAALGELGGEVEG